MLRNSSLDRLLNSPLGDPASVLDRLYRGMHECAAILARAQVFAFVEFLKNTLELRGDIFELEILFVKLGVTVLAKPEQTVEFSGAAFAFDDKAYGICAANGVVRNAWRKQEHLAFSDRHVDGLTVLLDLHSNVAFELIEKLFALVPVIILS